MPLSISDMKFAPVPKTTRANDHPRLVNKMGLTQPVFPKVNDKLGQTAEKSQFEAAVTHRDEENMTVSQYEGASLLANNL